MSERNLSTDFSTSPFYDDYDATKKFLRILFRPGLPVQARELTQLQTILNDQLSRLGSSIYDDGSTISGGDFSLVGTVSLKLDNTTGWDELNKLIIRRKNGRNYGVNDELLLSNGDDRVLVRLGLSGGFDFSLINNVTPSGFFGKIATENFNVNSGAEGAEFEVNVKISLNADPADGREERPIFHVQGFNTRTSNDPPTIFGEYLTGTEFVAGDEIYIYDDANQTYGISLGVLPSSFSSDSLIGSVSTGIFYTNGFYVLIDQQSTSLDKYDNTVSARVGYELREDIVTERDDETLLDNASGSANENAPGAHRFRIRLILAQRDILDSATSTENRSDEGFYEIARVVDGEIVDRNPRPNNSTMGKELAKRTYEVNGNFVIEPFKMTFDDKLLFTFEVNSQTGSNINVTTSLETLEIADFTDKMFSVNDIPYKISSASATGVNNVFDVTLTSVPTFVGSSSALVGETISVYDGDYFQTSFTPGKAYVNGYEFSTFGTLKRDVEKTTTARHVYEAQPETISVNFGNYIVTEEPVAGGLGAAITNSDIEFGSLFNMYATDDATGITIGTARIKQLRKSDNDRVEVYFFNSKFDTQTFTLSGDAVADGTNATIVGGTASTSADMLGAVFSYAGTRYRVIEVTSTTDLKLNIPLQATIPDTTVLTLTYNSKNIRSINLAGGALLKTSSTVLSDDDADGYLETKILGSDKTSLVFPLSDRTIDAVNDTQYRYYKTATLTLVGDSTPLTLNGALGESLWPVPRDYFVQNTSSHEIVPAANITINTTDDELTISGASGGNYYIIYPVVRNAATDPSIATSFIFGNTETYPILAGTDSIDAANGHVRIPASLLETPRVFQSIGLTGVFNVRGIYEISGATIGTDVTSRFNIDFGQRDEIVDHTKIALKPGFSKPTADVLVIVDRVRAGSVTFGEDIFYTANSYSSLYSELIPNFTNSTGNTYNLRNTIDFRPRAVELGSTVDFTSWVERTSKSFRNDVFVPAAAADSIFSCDLDYYMGRSDKVIISPELELKIIQGKPSSDPEAPIAEDRSIRLYDLYLKEYSTTTDDITSAVFDNIRYKMSDISKIEKRLENVEKSIQLDRVQKAVLAAEVSDRNNTNLFKTGILVDSFADDQVADVTHPDYLASIDRERHELRPPFDMYSFSLDYEENAAAGSPKFTEDGILLADYDDDNPVGIVEQVLATRTENVNPFAVMDWLGELKLIPEKDFWKDIVRKPDVVTDMSGSASAWSQLARNASRTDWGGWRTRWSGNSMSLFGRRGWGRSRITSSSRTGIRTTVSTQLKQENLGDKIVDQSVIEYMRSVPNGIRFRGLSMKPNTIVYPFFDEVSIMNHVRPAIVLVVPITDAQSRTIYDNATPLKTSVRISQGATNYDDVLLTHKTKNINYLYFHVTPGSLGSVLYDIDNTNIGDYQLFVGGTTATDEVTLESVIRQKVAADTFRLKTDPVGSVSGVFIVPEGEFKTGTRNFKLVDTSTGDNSTSKTSADRDFESSGLRQVVQRNIVTTRVPTVRRRRVSQSRVSVSTPRWGDPLAETFLVDDKQFPAGVFLHSIDLWFTSRDPSIPVTVQIRPTNNGYPDSQIIVPFSEVHVDPEDVVVTESPDVDNYTRFKFSTPVFLEPGEYSYVVMANSVNYELYTALMGEKILSPNTGLPGDGVMNKQPFAGVMFKSQNASTWSAYQEEDIMFRINRVEFIPNTYTGNIQTTFDASQLAALAPYKLGDNRFRYVGDGADYFMYNLFQINVPEIKDFEDTTEPSYTYRPLKVDNESVWTVGEPTSSTGVSTPVETNETIVSPQTFIMKESQPDSFNVGITFGTGSNLVSPLIDLQQMNVIFIENLIDNLEITPETDVTIISPGSGYVIGDQFTLRDTIDDSRLGQLEVTSVDAGGAIEQLGVTAGEEPFGVAGDVTISGNTATGDGLAELVLKSELDPEGGVAEAKYISKRVALKAGFESEDIKVTLSAYRPKGTRVYVYYKVKAGEDSDQFDNKPWIRMFELTNPDDYSIDNTDFLPLEFVTYRLRADGSVDSSTKGGSRYTVDGVTYEKFNTFALKVVMTSTTKNKTPHIENLGGMALISPIEPAGDS